MEKLMNFLKTDNGRLVGIAGGIVLLLLVIWAATPKKVNIMVSNGADCVVSFKSARKNNKRKPAKSKKDKTKK